MRETTLRSMTLAEVLASEIPRSSWLFFPYVGTGLWLLQGGTPEERLVLSIQMAMSASLGVNLLGGQEGDPRPVQLVCFGKDAPGLAHYLHSLENKEAADDVKFVFARDTSEAFAMLDKLEPGGLIILSGLPVYGTDAAEAFGPTIDAGVRDLLSKHIVIVDTTKPLQGADGHNSPVAGVITLKGGCDYPELLISGRKVSSARLYYDGVWKPMPLQGMSIDQELILEYLKTQPQAVKLAEIAKALGVSKNWAFQRRVHRMSKGTDPLLHQAEFGHYTYRRQHLISAEGLDMQEPKLA